MPPNLKTKLAVAFGGGALAIAVAVTGHFEGQRTKAYLDPVGIPTICYGSTAGVRIGQTRTPAECDRLLKGELGAALATVNRSVRVPMPDTRRAALASFVYNVGPGSFERSTLLRKLNAGDAVGACNELPRWVYAGGQDLPGLKTRRAAERELCLMS
ncbi:lysozyme [Crenobacter cavernae]|uniref:Lysozyme n=1 Tax=Crenobacter cavernae TaxID=2290923 RepID=A0ABY0FAN1_9NEIS|nr:lysozyme [Crenobacter cavernae]RXZ42721.1 lysozyme [Crenobacter cavernae]